MMNQVNQIILKHESALDDFVQWQIDYESTNDYSKFAEINWSHIDLPKYASILYREYIEVEGVLLWKDHYSEDNWKEWRRKSSPLASANMINHLHRIDLNFRNTDNSEIEDLTCELLVFFWNMALKCQFPNKKAEIKYDGNIIFLEQHIPESNMPIRKLDSEDTQKSQEQLKKPWWKFLQGIRS